MIKDNVMRVDVQRIFPNAWNPNRQSDFIYQKEINSIKKHGQVVPVLVREIDMGYEIIDGEHRFKAMREIGFTEISVNNLGPIDDSTCQQLTVILNEVKGKADTGLLADLLKTIEERVGRAALEECMPYTPIELDSYLKSVEVDWASLGRDAPEGPPAASAGDKDFSGQSSSAQDNQVFNSSPNGADTWTIYLKLPLEIAELFQDQLDRINEILFPEEENLKQISPTMAIQVICQHLAQIETDKLVDGPVPPS